MLAITVRTGDLSEKLDRLPDAVRDALAAEARGISALLLGIAQAKAGELLQVHTGSYVASIQAKVKVNPKSVTGEVFSKDPRAPALERGRYIAERDIRPRSAKALAFLGSSGEVFAAIVHQHDVHFKKHPVFHSTYMEEKDEVAARLVYAGTQAAKLD